MRAEPKRWTYFDDGTAPRVHAGRPGEGMFIECEITHPPSSAGRSLQVYLSSADVTALLLELRDQARRDREQPEKANA